MLKSDKIFILILLIAVVIRIYPLNHGYPFIFHPDEPTVIRSALGMRFNLNPDHFDWPHLFIYLNFALYMAFAFIRKVLESNELLSIILNWFPIIKNDILIYYYLTRLFAGLLGAFTIIPIYLIGKKLFNSYWVGLISAAVFAVLPFHVWHSHYSLIDVPMLFFFTWSLYYSVQIFVRGDFRYYLLAGLFVGLAASTKYHGALASLAVILAHFLPSLSIRDFLNEMKRIHKLIFSGAMSLLGFFIGTPYALLDFETFSRTDGPKGAFWQFTNVGSVGYLEQFTKFFQLLIIKLADDTGYIVLAIFLAGSIYLLLRRKFSKELFFIVIPPLLFTYYIAGFDKSRSHYLMITYPFICVAFGYYVTQLGLLVQKRNNTLVWLLTLLLLLPPFMYSIYQNYVMSRDDTRVMLYRWIKENSLDSATFYYDSSSLKPILDESNVVNSKKIKYTDFSRSYLPALLVVAFDDDEYAEFRAINTFGNEKTYMKIKKEFLSDNRNGPNILVYGE